MSSYYPGVARNVFHSMNKLHESKLTLRQEQDELRQARNQNNNNGTPTTENDDDDYQNQNLYNPNDEEEREVEKKIAKQHQLVKISRRKSDDRKESSPDKIIINEDEELAQEDETTRRERLHTAEQEKKRQKMLSEALDKFSEETKTFRDRQTALLQIKNDAERKWSQVKSVRMKVAALQAVAVSGKTGDSTTE